jgi:hypothetical protein
MPPTPRTEGATHKGRNTQHMTRHGAARVAAIPVALALLIAACGDDDDAAEPAGDTSAPAETGGDAGSLAGALADICPSPLVIQTDWFPEAEHGALYEMVGDGYVVDKEKKTVTAPLIASGEDTGIDIEIRTGGPAIGFSPVHSTMYTDTSIHIAYTSLDASATFYEDQPTIAVVAPLEKNPQIVMWDPETYPDAKTIADISDAGVTINVFPGNAWMDVFINEGTVDASLVDPSYDGSPARFIAEGGKMAQQGFASAEPYTYANDFAEWGKDVAYQLVHDAGFEAYTQPLGIRTADLDKLRPCLEKFVPIVQQATVDNINDPTRANKIIVDVVAQYADFWVYGDGVAAYGSQTMKDLGLVSNGPDATIGNFDEDRVQKVIDQMIAVDLAPADLKASDIVTNEFIDPSIGL